MITDTLSLAASMGGAGYGEGLDGKTIGNISAWTPHFMRRPVLPGFELLPISREHRSASQLFQCFQCGGEAERKADLVLAFLPTSSTSTSHWPRGCAGWSVDTSAS